MKFSESIKNIAEALCKVQSEIKNPIKTAVNKGVQGAPKYATLEDTLDDIRPILSKHGMSFTQSVESIDMKVGVKTVLFHSSGEYIEGDTVFCEVEIPISRDGKKILTIGQATGVNITYLRRYSLNAALGITGDADTDGSMQDLPPVTSETAKDFVITFGKHGGKTLKEIHSSSPDYIDWLRNADKTTEDVKQAIDMYLAGIETPKETATFRCAMCGKELTKDFYTKSILKYKRALCSAECKAKADEREKETGVKIISGDVNGIS